MTLEDRTTNIENIVMQQHYLKGRSFRVKYEPTPLYEFHVIFEKIAQWQLNRVRQRFFELQLKHVRIDGKEITDEPKPHKFKKR